MRIVLRTERLTLREFEPDDAPFILDLLNQPSFLQFIGDKGVRTLDDAREYLRSGPIRSYAAHGFGLYLVTRKDDVVPIGMCGLVRREALAEPDIGFAFLPAYWSVGYATESARAVLDHAARSLDIARVVAVTSPGNDRSIKVLGKLGLRFESMIRLTDEGDEVMLFGPAAATGA